MSKLPGMDDCTKTRPRRSSEGTGEARVWKLWVLYSGTVGIVRPELSCWDGCTELTIGRRTAAPRVGSWLLLDDEMTSRANAKLSLHNERPVVEDLDSKNGTMVNNRPLLPSEKWEIGDGDMLRVGDSLILLRYEPALLADVANPALVGISAAMRRLRRALADAARTEHPVLLMGETGTGKGVTASAIHQCSGRRGKLVSVNCAATPASLAESLFFGSRRGAFTGAVEQAGFFREADQGTLFLDEIGDLPIEIQPKLLHALETREVVPLGSSRPTTCDARIVAATNRDLDAALCDHTFRRDLYARLSASVLRLPPVRERREDILLLAQHLAGPTFRPSVRLAVAMLLYDWPSNVREIGNVIRQLGSSGEGDVCREMEAAANRHRAPQPSADAAEPSPSNGRSAPSKRTLLTMLEHYQGNIQKIAVAHHYSRRQIGRWVQEYEIDLSRFRPKKQQRN